MMKENDWLYFKQRGSRVVRQKGKAALGLLDPLESLGRRHCCVDQCVRVGCLLTFIYSALGTFSLAGKIIELS